MGSIAWNTPLPGTDTRARISSLLAGAPTRLPPDSNVNAAVVVPGAASERKCLDVPPTAVSIFVSAEEFSFNKWARLLVPLPPDDSCQVCRTLGVANRCDCRVVWLALPVLNAGCSGSSCLATSKSYFTVNARSVGRPSRSSRAVETRQPSASASASKLVARIRIAAETGRADVVREVSDTCELVESTENASERSGELPDIAGW